MLARKPRVYFFFFDRRSISHGPNSAPQSAATMGVERASKKDPSPRTPSYQYDDRIERERERRSLRKCASVFWKRLFAGALCLPLFFLRLHSMVQSGH